MAEPYEYCLGPRNGKRRLLASRAADLPVLRACYHFNLIAAAGLHRMASENNEHLSPRMKPRYLDIVHHRIPQKWQAHYQMLQSLRRDLMKDRQQRNYFKPIPHREGTCGWHIRPTDGFNPNLALGILSLEQDAMAEVDAAIRRIIDGTYGNCEISGKPIPAARLQVVPWTRYTKEVLELIEREALPVSGRHPSKFAAKPSRYGVSGNNPRTTPAIHLEFQTEQS
jgi:RNA polymerase-binding transcription factor DksA